MFSYYYNTKHVHILSTHHLPPALPSPFSLILSPPVSYAAKDEQDRRCPKLAASACCRWACSRTHKTLLWPHAVPWALLGHSSRRVGEAMRHQTFERRRRRRNAHSNGRVGRAVTEGREWTFFFAPLGHRVLGLLIDSLRLSGSVSSPAPLRLPPPATGEWGEERRGVGVLCSVF